MKKILFTGMLIFSGSLALAMEEEGSQRTIQINKIINESGEDAYLLVPTVERESTIRGKRLQPLPESAPLTKSMMILNLPINKIEGYRIQHKATVDEPLRLTTGFQKHFIVLTHKGRQNIDVDNYKTLKIYSTGQARGEY